MNHGFTPFALLLLGNFASSTSAIFIKECRVEPVALSGWRLVMAAAMLAPWFFRDLRRHGAAGGSWGGRRYLAPALALACHFALWSWAVPRTTAVNATLVVNMVPLAMPLFLWIFLKEKLAAAERCGTALSLLGLGTLVYGDLRLGWETMLGDALAFGSMLIFCWYMILARRNRDLPIFLYVTPLYLLAGLFCLGASALGESLPRIYAARDWLLLLGLALAPTVIGHSTFNWAMQRMRGAIVSLSTLTQVIFAGVLACPLLGEKPAPAFYAAAALVAAGMAVALRPQRGNRQEGKIT